MKVKASTNLNKIMFTALVGPVMCAPVFAQDPGKLMLEEVVVTAQKREQTLQEVPVSVTAFSGNYLEEQGIVDIRGITGETPGLEIGGGDTESAVFIRGIGSVAPGIGADPAVGIYIDGISGSRGTNATSAFFDVERIEVVKGPQGTLFGRNASAGAISITTNKPEMDESYGRVMGSVGDNGQYRGQLIGNLAVNDRFAVRAGVNYEERDGLHKNTFAGEELLDRENTVYRLAARYDITDTWQSTLMFENLKFEGNDAIVTDADAFQDKVAQNGRPRKSELDSDRYAWTNNWDLNDDMSLTAITGYMDFDVWVQPVDADETEFAIATFIEPQTNKTFSQELRLNGSTDKLDWFVGASYVQEKLEFTTELSYDEAIILDIFGAGDLCQDPELPECVNQTETPNGKNTVDSYAVYGDFTYHMTDLLSVTLGARYTDDQKDMSYSNPATNGVLGAVDGQLTGPVTDGKVSAKDNWNSFDPRIAVDYDITDSTTVFANIAKGYKSGGINRQVSDFLPNAQALNTFDEEKVIAYEIGTKSRFMDGRASLNVSAFFNDYEDFQLETLEGLIPEVFNVGDLETKGVELEGRMLVTSNFEVSATYAYLDSEITNSTTTINGAPIEGNKSPQAPENSGSISARYTIPFGPGEFALSGSWQLSDDYWFDISNELDQPSYNVLNLRVGYETDDGKWGVAVLVDNVTDEEYYAGRFVFLDVANRRAAGSMTRVEVNYNF